MELFDPSIALIFFVTLFVCFISRPHEGNDNEKKAMR